MKIMIFVMDVLDRYFILIFYWTGVIPFIQISQYLFDTNK